MLVLSLLAKGTGVCASPRPLAVPARALSPLVHSQFKINTRGEHDLECTV